MISTPALLITDDDRAFRETLQGVFEPRGFTTLLAADGLEALEIARSHAVHLLLLDMHMPQLTGLETIRRLRESAVQTPCILMSAKLDQEVVAAARQSTYFPYFLNRSALPPSQPLCTMRCIGLISGR